MKISADMGYLPAVNEYSVYASTGAPGHLKAGAMRLSSDEGIRTKLELSRTKAYKWLVKLKFLSIKQGRDYVSGQYSNFADSMLRSACLLGKDNFYEIMKKDKIEAQSKDADEVIAWLKKHGTDLTPVERSQIHCYFGNIEKANKIVHEAANNNNPWAQRRLASAYMSGRFGNKKDPVKAQEIASKAIATYRHLSEQGDIKASVALAAELLQGTYIERDLNQAYSLCKSAAEKGHPESYRVLSSLYAYGMGTNKDEAQAYYWYTKALAHYPYLHLHNPLEELKKNQATTGPELTDAINRYEKALIALPQ
jgi:hypothetical protein